jgi:chemotaxis protein MotB
MAIELPPEEGPAGAPAWIVTFTDMMSLLLTFFVLLLTFTTKETEKLNQMSGALSAEFGGVGGRGESRMGVGPSTSPENGLFDAKGDDRKSLRKEVEGALDRRVQNRRIFNTRILVDDVRYGVRLNLEPTDGGEMFEIGSSTLSLNTRELVSEIGAFFKGQRVRLLIETAVDNMTWRVSASKSAWEQTRLLAIETAKLLEDAGVTPEHVGICPLGDAHPRVANDTAMHRYQNRRLCIVVLPLAEDPLFDEKAAD